MTEHDEHDYTPLEPAFFSNSAAALMVSKGVIAILYCRGCGDYTAILANPILYVEQGKPPHLIH